MWFFWWSKWTLDHESLQSSLVTKVNGFTFFLLIARLVTHISNISSTRSDLHKNGIVLLLPILLYFADAQEKWTRKYTFLTVTKEKNRKRGVVVQARSHDHEQFKKYIHRIKKQMHFSWENLFRKKCRSEETRNTFCWYIWQLAVAWEHRECSKSEYRLR